MYCQYCKSKEMSLNRRDKPDGEHISIKCGRCGKEIGEITISNSQDERSFYEEVIVLLNKRHRSDRENDRLWANSKDK